MSTPTHYESWQQLLAPYIALAEKAVRKDGWHAYPKFLEKCYAQNIVRSKVKPSDPESLMASAILHCFVDYQMQQFEDPNSIEQAMKNPELNDLGEWFVDMFSAIKGKLHASEEFSTMITHLYHTSVHRRSGENTYEVSSGLGDRLAHTEVRGLTTDDVRLPFPNIYIIVPPEAGLKISDATSSEQICNGFYVTEDLNGGRGRTWRVLALGASSNAKDPFDDALFHFSMTLPNGQDLDETLMKQEERSSITTTWARSDSSRELYKRVWRNLFQFVLNVVLYITYPDARKEYVIGNPEARRLSEQMRKHPKGSNKYERARERLREIQQQRRVYLGRGLEPLTDNEGTGTPRGPLTIRVKVAGHWKMQPHGPNNSLRKIIWREPFWRGPLSGPEPKTIHVL